MDGEKSERLVSLDAVRGFDMLFIMGFTPVVTALCALLGMGNCWLAQQMQHVPWHGFAHHDTIFPFFLFIAGISFPFSLAKQRARGVTTSRTVGKILYRGLMLVFLGWIYNGLFMKGFGEVRYASVLGRIGLAWMFAAFLYLAFGLRTRILIAVGILIGYWALMRFVPVPGAPAGADVWSHEWNLAGWFDMQYLPHSWTNGDPEGLLSTLPAVVTAMLGMFTGEFVRLEKGGLTGGRKVAAMLVAAGALAIGALVFSRWMPVNKKIWTSTFVLAAGSYSLAVFALFYGVIDVLKWRKWAFFFCVIGMNSILIYLLQRIVNFDSVAGFFLGGLAQHFPKDGARLVIAMGHVVVAWLLLWFCYRKKAFLKV